MSPGLPCPALPLPLPLPLLGRQAARLHILGCPVPAARPPAHLRAQPPRTPGSPCCREWADFDEKLGESGSIMGVESEFRQHKK